MDSFQQPHGYNRHPPPPPADLHHFHQVQPHRPPAPPPQSPWYSSQFQYHLSQTPNPSPPLQWAPTPPPPPPPPPPHSNHLPFPPQSNYFPPQHSYHQSHCPPAPPPPLSHIPSQFPVHSQISQSYPPANQEWGSQNWAHNQGWNYPAHKNEEDWAARARAWADAKAAMDNQHLQSQFTPTVRQPEQSHYHDQYPQSVNLQYPDVPVQSLPASNYQHFPVSAASLHQPLAHPQEAASISSETSYIPDGHLSHTVRDGAMSADQTVSFQHQGNLSSSPSVHQQEVPSSYSSLTGKEETPDKSEELYKSLPLSNSLAREGQHYVQPPLHTPHPSGNQSVGMTTNLADQPLDFVPRFNQDHEMHMQSSYAHHESMGPVRGIDPVAQEPSMNNWAPPVAPGVVYHPIPTVLASGPQHDPSIVTPPLPGHTAPSFGRFLGPGLPPAVPSGGTPYPFSAGTSLHPSPAFSADVYAAPGISERPKKASVPNWLREEIKKAVIAPPMEHPKGGRQFVDDEGVNKAYGKGDQADSKSIDSSRSTEEEEDDLDYVEAARTAAINQEIKRVLTEVLLKVTDELFDEIANKVLSEDDSAVEDCSIVTSNYKGLPSPPSALTQKASAKVLVPVKSKDTETFLNEKSNSSPPGDVLGLANYASDDDDGDSEIHSLMSNSAKYPAMEQSGIIKSKDGHNSTENGSSDVKLEQCDRSLENMTTHLGESNLNPSKANDKGVTMGQLHDSRQNRESSHEHSSKEGEEDRESKLNSGKKMHDGSNVTSFKVSLEKATDTSYPRDTSISSSKADRHEKSSSNKDFVKEALSSEISGDDKGKANHSGQHERHQRKDKDDESNCAKEKMKEKSLKLGEKAKESESRKRSLHAVVKEDRKENERAHKSGATYDTNRKKELTKDKGVERSRHKDSSNSDRHKRRRSSSVSSRGRSSRDDTLNHTNDSSDEGSDGSKRKLHSRNRDFSPSPVRSRRRQVSRSPHSKHSQRRHSPYSSLDTTRRRR